MLYANDSGKPDDGLLAALLRDFGVADVERLARKVNDDPTVENWAPHAPAIFAAADAGSALAVRVIADGAKALADNVAQLIERGAVGTGCGRRGFGVRQSAAIGRGVQVRARGEACPPRRPPSHGRPRRGRRVPRPQGSDQMIAVESVSKSFPVKGGPDVEAVRSVSLTIGDNEFFTLLGPSGCGKTTLLRLIAGFEAPSRGDISIDGVAMAGVPPQKRPVNTVFQSYALFPHMSVAANVAFGLEMLGVPQPAIRQRVGEALDMVGLSAFGGRSPTLLSGGQQQRVALARALAPKPRVLLLDEPLSALDLKLRRQMQGELKRLQGETGIAFVLVTHDQEEALAMSDRLAVMSGGNVLQVGAPRDIYDNPQSRFVADFIGESNLLSGSELGRAAGITVAVRPEKVRLSTGAGRVRGTVAAITFLGLDTVYDVDPVAAAPSSKRGCATTRRRSRRALQSASTGRTTPSGSCSIERAGHDAQGQRPGADRARRFSSSASSW